MRLRCPHQGCSIEVADDMVGARIRCPHCDQLLFVDPAFQEGAPGQPVEAGEAANLENRLYAGVPPLSVMLALRAGRPPLGKDDPALRAEMTPDDWKALAAFETVVHAVVSLPTTLGIGLLTALLTGTLWTAVLLGPARGIPAVPGLSFGLVASLTALGVAMPLMELGRRRLQRLQIDRLVGLVAWSALSVALVFAVHLLLNLMLLFDDSYGGAQAGFSILASPFQLAAAFLAARTSLQVQRALNQVSPPEILHRLVEALKYLT